MMIDLFVSSTNVTQRIVKVAYDKRRSKTYFIAKGAHALGCRLSAPIFGKVDGKDSFGRL